MRLYSMKTVQGTRHAKLSQGRCKRFLLLMRVRWLLATAIAIAINITLAPAEKMTLLMMIVVMPTKGITTMKMTMR